MYEYDDYNEEYYDLTKLDIVMNEYKDKCKNILLQSIQDEMATLRKENIDLKLKNEEYRNRESEIRDKEHNLEYKERDLKRKVKEDFYNETIMDTLNTITEDYIVWYPEIEYYLSEKCNLCNGDRKISAQYPSGEVITKNCLCAKSLKRYIPSISKLKTITINKNNSRYDSDRKFYISHQREQGEKSYDYAYGGFSITIIKDKFDDDVKDCHEKKKYDEKIGLRSEEECQKYCDWLNERL
jgi:hypothetical protein